MMAAREVLFDRDLFIELGIAVAGPTDILSDSQSAVGMAFDPISFKNTKHINRRIPFAFIGKLVVERQNDDQVCDFTRKHQQK